MTVQRAPAASLRMERLDSSRLLRALVLSALVHFLCWGGYSAGKRYHVWEKLDWPAWLRKLTAAPLIKPNPKSPPLDRQIEPPLMFVNVNPDVATPEPPKNAKYYASLNSKAANPNPDRDTDVPKISGKQEFVPETETVDRNKYNKLQPAPAPTPAESEQREKPRPKIEPGDLALGKPEPNPRRDEGESEKPRPRTLAQVDPQKASRLPSQKMRQDGGVRRDLNLESLDAKATPFGRYDQIFIDAVKQRWFDLLDAIGATTESRGKVVLEFKLHHDGRITDLKVLESTVNYNLSLLCQKAILDPAPFEKWSSEMRLLQNADYRTLKFTFIYY